LEYVPFIYPLTLGLEGWADTVHHVKSCRGMADIRQPLWLKEWRRISCKHWISAQFVSSRQLYHRECKLRLLSKTRALPHVQKSTLSAMNILAVIFTITCSAAARPFRFISISRIPLLPHRASQYSRYLSSTLQARLDADSTSLP
jgi:hypothetical protein